MLQYWKYFFMIKVCIFIKKNNELWGGIKPILLLPGLVFQWPTYLFLLNIWLHFGIGSSVSRDYLRPKLYTDVPIRTVVLVPILGALFLLSFLQIDLLKSCLLGRIVWIHHIYRQTPDWELLGHCTQPSSTNDGPFLFLGLAWCEKCLSSTQGRSFLVLMNPREYSELAQQGRSRETELSKGAGVPFCNRNKALWTDGMEAPAGKYGWSTSKGCLRLKVSHGAEAAGNQGCCLYFSWGRQQGQDLNIREEPFAILTNQHPPIISPPAPWLICPVSSSGSKKHFRTTTTTLWTWIFVKVSFSHQGPASGWMGEFCQPSNLTAFKHVQHFSKQIGSLIWSTVQHPGGRAGDLIAPSWWSHSAVFLKSTQTFHFDKTRSQRERQPALTSIVHSPWTFSLLWGRAQWFNSSLMGFLKISTFQIFFSILISGF